MLGPLVLLDCAPLQSKLVPINTMRLQRSFFLVKIYLNQAVHSDTSQPKADLLNMSQNLSVKVSARIFGVFILFEVYSPFLRALAIFSAFCYRRYGTRLTAVNINYS